MVPFYLFGRVGNFRSGRDFQNRFSEIFSFQFLFVNFQSSIRCKGLLSFGYSAILIEWWGVPHAGEIYPPRAPY